MCGEINTVLNYVYKCKLSHLLHDILMSKMLIFGIEEFGIAGFDLGGGHRCRAHCNMPLKFIEGLAGMFVSFERQGRKYVTSRLLFRTCGGLLSALRSVHAQFVRKTKMADQKPVSRF